MMEMIKSEQQSQNAMICSLGIRNGVSEDPIEFQQLQLTQMGGLKTVINDFLLILE